MKEMTVAEEVSLNLGAPEFTNEVDSELLISQTQEDETGRDLADTRVLGATCGKMVCYVTEQ